MNNQGSMIPDIPVVDLEHPDEDDIINSISKAVLDAWRHILSARGWLANRARYVIFEGHSINIWYDPWLNGRGLKDALGRELLTWGPPHQTPLSVLINNGKWTKPSRWNPTLEALWDEITQLDVGGIGDDILIWLDSRSG
ncbi:hypothetical protein QJS10_CPB17g00609 [Acorus calamus]|uniref:Uncharacterized protein n=1 Tax=Acorus calamus TaxID=4465 RepID=A0AAV9CQK1_ACOCL|nr:hypothetical protein QJS10_CPB17g00609 [Acorus calamus]